MRLHELHEMWSSSLRSAAFRLTRFRRLSVQRFTVIVAVLTARHGQRTISKPIGSKCFQHLFDTAAKVRYKQDSQRAQFAG